MELILRLDQGTLDLIQKELLKDKERAKEQARVAYRNKLQKSLLNDSYHHLDKNSTGNKSSNFIPEDGYDRDSTFQVNRGTNMSSTIDNVKQLMHITLDSFMLAVMTVLTSMDKISVNDDEMIALMALEPITPTVFIPDGFKKTQPTIPSSADITPAQSVTSSVNGIAFDFASPMSVGSPSFTYRAKRRNQFASTRAAATSAIPSQSVSIQPANQSMLHMYEKKQLQLLKMVNGLRRIFDCVDVDHQGYIAWSDLTNYCIRAGNFAFRGSISQANTSFTQVEGVAGSITTVASRKLHFIQSLNSLWATDSVQSMIRMYCYKNYLGGVSNGGGTGGNVRIHGILYPHRTFSQRIFHSIDHKPKTLSGSLVFQRSRQITAADDLHMQVKKRTILGLVAVERKRCICITTADRYIMTLSYRDPYDILVKEFKPTQYEIIRYQFSEHPQSGIVYSQALDCLVTWAGEDDKHLLRLWHVEELSLLSMVSIHEGRILDVCEIPSNVERSFMISSDNVGKVIVWTAKLSMNHSSSSIHEARPLTKVLPLVMQLRAEQPLLDHTNEDQVTKFELKGHNRSIRSFVFAKQSGLVIGAGFDFEIYVWDPWAKMLIMKLIGHVASLFKVIVVYCPSERVVSVDEDGCLKIWNIERDVVGYGELLQSMSLEMENSSTKVCDIAPAFDQGRIFAVQFFALEDDRSMSQDIAMVKGGLGYCPTSGGLFAVSDDLLTIANLRSGKVLKRLFFADEQVSDISHSSADRTIDSLAASTAHDISDILMLKSSMKPSQALKQVDHSPKKGNADPKTSSFVAEVLISAVSSGMNGYSHINPKDKITVAAFDASGKKLYLGTYLGRVLLYDSNTFGLLRDLTLFDDSYHEGAGEVAAMNYSHRDSLLVVVYANGNLRAYNGLFRNPQGPEIDSKANGSIHRRPPASPILLRSTTYSLCPDNSITSLALSEDTNTIAISSSFGRIYVYAYDTFILHNVLQVPHMHAHDATSSNHATDIKIQGITFLDRLPVLAVGDSIGRVTLFLVYPELPRWIYTWNPAQCPNHSSLQIKLNAMRVFNASAGELEDRAGIVDIKCLVIDESSHPESIHENLNDSNNRQEMNIQQVIRSHSPSVTPTFAARNMPSKKSSSPRFPRRSDVSFSSPSNMNSDGNYSSKQSNSIGKFNRTSSRLVADTLRARYYVVMITSVGRIIVQDMTTLLRNAGLISLSAMYDRDLGDMSVYNVVSRPTMIDGCRQINTLEGLEAMIRDPIGSRVSVYTIPSYNIALRDINTMAHWRVEREGIPLSYARSKTMLAVQLSNLLFIPTTIIKEPYYLAACSERGDVHLWTWNGEKYLGRWHDLKSKDRLSEMISQPNQSMGNHLKSSESSNHGWKIPNNTLLPPIFTYDSFCAMTTVDKSEIQSSKRSKGKNKAVQAIQGHGKPGEDWVSFLEEIHQRGLALSSNPATSSTQLSQKTLMTATNTYEYEDSSAIQSAATSRPTTAPISRPNTTTTNRHRGSTGCTSHRDSMPRLHGDSVYSNESVVANDYNVWKESLTAMDSVQRDERDEANRDSFTLTYASTSRSSRKDRNYQYHKKRRQIQQRLQEESDDLSKDEIMMQRLVHMHINGSIREARNQDAEQDLDQDDRPDDRLDDANHPIAMMNGATDRLMGSSMDCELIAMAKPRVATPTDRPPLGIVSSSNDATIEAKKMKLRPNIDIISITPADNMAPDPRPIENSINQEDGPSSRDHIKELKGNQSGKSDISLSRAASSQLSARTRPYSAARSKVDSRPRTAPSDWNDRDSPQIRPYSASIISKRSSAMSSNGASSSTAHLKVLKYVQRIDRIIDSIPDTNNAMEFMRRSSIMR